MEQEIEITGPVAAKLFAPSTTTDMDLFVILQAFLPDGREVDCSGTVGSTHAVLAWLAACLVP